MYVCTGCDKDVLPRNVNGHLKNKMDDSAVESFDEFLSRVFDMSTDDYVYDFVKYPSIGKNTEWFPEPLTSSREPHLWKSNDEVFDL